MTLSLVFAMSGGAYAAKHYLITSTKQISPKVLKALEGKRGPAGAVGAPGAAGISGKEGAPGKEGVLGKEGPEGKSGVNGKSVVTGNAGAECKEGGATVEVEGNPASKKHVCNGSPWTVNGTLPKGATETGVLAAAGIGVETGFDPKRNVVVPIDFPVPVASPLVAEGCEEEPQVEPCQVHLIAPEEGEGEAGKLNPAITAKECLGNVTKPRAAEGNLCLFLQNYTENTVDLQRSGAGPLKLGYFHTWVGNPMTMGSGAGTTGALLFLHPLPTKESETLIAFGTWAVTG